MRTQRSASSASAPTPRLIDVAAAAGVSVSTASEILRGKPDSWASKTTRQAVLAAAAQLGYRPNHMARSLRQRSTRTLGLLFPGMTNDYVTAQAEAIYQQAMARGWRVLLSPLLGDAADQHAQVVQNLLDMQIDGLFVFSPYRPWTAAGLAAAPGVVWVDTVYDGEPLARSAAVHIDRARGVEQAVTQLLATGRHIVRPILDLHDPLDPRSRPAVEKRDGWRRAYKAAGRAAPEDLLVRVPFGEATVDDGLLLGRTLLDDAKNKHVDALLVCDDMLAIGICHAFAERGVRVPEDVAIIGFGDQRACQVPAVRLASVGVPTDRTAAAALRQMERLLDPDRTKKQVPAVHVAAQYRPRASSDPAPASA